MNSSLKLQLCALHAALDLPVTHPDVEILNDEESPE